MKRARARGGAGRASAPAAAQRQLTLTAASAVRKTTARVRVHAARMCKRGGSRTLRLSRLTVYERRRQRGLPRPLRRPRARALVKCSTGQGQGGRARELLQVVRAEARALRLLVEQHMVVRRARGALDARVAVEEEAELGGVHDRAVHHRACAAAPQDPDCRSACMWRHKPDSVGCMVARSTTVPARQRPKP